MLIPTIPLPEKEMYLSGNNFLSKEPVTVRPAGPRTEQTFLDRRKQGGSSLA